jgi:hypothetical protein
VEGGGGVAGEGRKKTACFIKNIFYILGVFLMQRGLKEMFSFKSF